MISAPHVGQPAEGLAPTPLWWRGVILAVLMGLVGLAYACQTSLGLRGRAAIGVFCFVGICALFSGNLRAVNWRTIAWGFALQIGLVLFILQLGWNVTDASGVTRRFRPGYELFQLAGSAVKKFLEFSDSGARFVFGPLASGEQMDKVFGAGNGFVFAASALPPIIFVSSFFTVLYYFGILQLVVRVFARAMVYLMQTSGAETLSAAANVFMGQTEAPLIVKPYVARMTQSELLAMMVGGMATIAGGIMAVYIKMGADPVAILATSVMAAPCGLYLAKILLPELEQPETRGTVRTQVEKLHRNAIDAAAAGASDGMMLAINVAAMLIAFLAFLAMFNHILSWWNPDWSLARIFSKVFGPMAFLMGVEGKDVAKVAELLGIKLAANEFVAYVELTSTLKDQISHRSFVLATYALTGFANFASIGIQIGGIGAMAPSRRSDLARLGPRALLAGFLATLVNASMAGMLLP